MMIIIIIRIGFLGAHYTYDYNKERPKPYSKYLGPYIAAMKSRLKESSWCGINAHSLCRADAARGLELTLTLKGHIF